MAIVGESQFVRQFRNAAQEHDAIIRTRAIGNQPLARAGLRVWLKSVFDIGDARLRNQQTIADFRQALLNEPRYANLTQRAEALLGKLEPRRPLSSRAVRDILRDLDGHVDADKSRNLTQRHLHEACSALPKALTLAAREDMFNYIDIRDTLLAIFDKPNSPVSTHDYTRGPFPLKLLDKMVGKLQQALVECKAKIDAAEIHGNERQTLWTAALRILQQTGNIEIMKRRVDVFAGDKRKLWLLNEMCHSSEQSWVTKYLEKTSKQAFTMFSEGKVLSKDDFAGKVFGYALAERYWNKISDELTRDIQDGRFENRVAYREERESKMRESAKDMALEFIQILDDESGPEKTGSDKA